MAISILNSFGINAVFSPSNSVSGSINLNAGSNRVFLAFVAGVDVGASSPPPEALPAVVTYGGVPMEFLRGPSGVQSFRSTTSGTFRTYGLLYYLRESQLPPNGANDMDVSWPGLSGSSWGFRGMTWELGNVDQAVPVRDVQVRESSFASPTDAPTAPGGTSDALILGATLGTPAGTTDLTVNGGAVVEDMNVAIGGVGRTCAVAQAAAGSLAGLRAAFTYTTTAGNVLIAARLSEFFAPVGGSCIVEVGL